MNKKLLTFIILLCLLFPSYCLAHDYENHWAKSNIENAINNKLAFGSTDGNFYPDNSITRAEFISLLVNHMLREGTVTSTRFFTAFNDVSPSAWYFPSVVIAEENSIASGYEDGGFHPSDFLSRQDAVVFACRAYKINPPANIVFKTYSDSADISSYALNFIQYAASNNIIVGYENNTFKPKKTLTRAEALVMIENFSSSSPKFDDNAEFADGFPKISPAGEAGSITVELKTTKPCTIYYKSVKKGEFSTYITPKKENITDFLAYISEADTVIKAVIPANSTDEEYNLFFMPISEKGDSGTIKRIKDVKAMLYEQGDGSKENPYIIKNQNQLSNIRYFQGNYFKLANDITLSGEWTPINASDSYFIGIDGDGHTIRSLCVSGNKNNSGLFSVLKNGEIKNLAIIGNVSGGISTGLFAGRLENSEISGCVALGYVEASSNAGGFVGTNNGKITNSLSAVMSVDADANAGAFAGNGSGSIVKCISACKRVRADMYAGALAGINSGGEITSSVSAGLEIENSLYTGGGKITSSKDGGLASNNYIYSASRTTVLNSASSSNGDNGTEVDWSKLISRDFYEKNISDDFFENWKISSSSKFILPFPRAFSDIEIETGATPYSPVKIKSEAGLNSMIPDFHYVLLCDITMSRSLMYNEEEFSGSFDGRGHFISNLNISHPLFNTLSGTVRNLTLKNVTSSSSILCGENYGLIEGCEISGKIKLFSSDTSNTGALCSFNYGTVTDCLSKTDFEISSLSSTAGGIASHNEGFIRGCSYKGNALINFLPDSASSFGGIVGFNNEGMIYECYAKTDVLSKANISYTGGICGILSSGEIYKCSSNKSLNNTLSENNSVSYCGGIAAMASSGLIYSCFSAAKINTSSASGFSGGLCGYNDAANIQSSYAINTVLQADNGYSFEKGFFAGGIFGFNSRGFISDNVSLNPWIVSSGNSFKTGYSSEEFLSNNYSVADKSRNSSPVLQNGTELDIKKFENLQFFFMPVHLGGKLGWQTDGNKEDAVWKIPDNLSVYKFPVLKNVDFQSEFTTPDEYK